MELLLRQTQKLTQLQYQNIELLQMGSLELSEYLQELSQENPVMDLEASFSNQMPAHKDDVVQRLQWLEDNDRQNQYYTHADAEDPDPIAQVGTMGGLQETLEYFLTWQVQQLKLDIDTERGVQYIISALDDNGYLAIPLCELSRQYQLPLQKMKKCLSIVQSLEPAGVGAENLSRCLELQLQRIGKSGPVLQIVRDHLELLAKHAYRAIAAKLKITVADVLAAKKTISQLEPRPGTIFEKAEMVLAVLPDVIVREEDGRFIACLRASEKPAFRINQYYRTLLAQSEDADVRKYLGEKIRQAEGLLWAIDQRGNTLLRCAQAIVDHQSRFFRDGPGALNSLRMLDIADELEIHESTVSRAVREKYLQCAQGVYPLAYFFSVSASSRRSGSKEVSRTAAHTMLRRIIEGEDKRIPLSDQQLCEVMSRAGCPISRRTVAKYRDELNIPNTSGRKLR